MRPCRRNRFVLNNTINQLILYNKTRLNTMFHAAFVRFHGIFILLQGQNARAYTDLLPGKQMTLQRPLQGGILRVSGGIV